MADSKSQSRRKAVQAPAPTNAKELEAAGFIRTDEVWHTGRGDGHVYEKVSNGKRTYVRVDENNKVVNE